MRSTALTKVAVADSSENGYQIIRATRRLVGVSDERGAIAFNLISAIATREILEMLNATAPYALSKTAILLELQLFHLGVDSSPKLLPSFAQLPTLIHSAYGQTVCLSCLFP
jgi:hypothetical protein